MVAKKEDIKDVVLDDNDTSAVKKKKKTTTTTKKKTAEKVAIKKLKKEVKDVKKEAKKEVKSDKNELSVADNVSLSKVDSEVKIVKKKENSIVLSNGFTDKNLSANGKIAEMKNGVVYATGHRKRAIAKVSCKEKSGKLLITVNNLDYKSFFTKLLHQDIVMAPFAILGIQSGYVVNAEVFGGGKSGQADALKLGLSRCLSFLSEEYSKVLRKNSFLTRDARKVESKKAGLKKARKKEQFSKR